MANKESSADSFLDMLRNRPIPITCDEGIIELRLLSSRQTKITKKLSQLMNVRSDLQEDLANAGCDRTRTNDGSASSKVLLSTEHLEKIAGEDVAENVVNDTIFQEDLKNVGCERTSMKINDKTIGSGKVKEKKTSSKFWTLDPQSKMKRIAIDLNKDLASADENDYDEESAPLVVALRKLQDKNIKQNGIKMWTDSLADLFYVTDVDGSGSIQPAEYKKMIDKLDVSESMKIALCDKFVEIDMDRDNSISLWEFLYFFLRFPKFNEELLQNSQNNAPYIHEKDLSIWQSLRLSVYMFIECPNRNLASKALFCLDLMLTSVPVVVLFLQALRPSQKLDWGEETYLWVISIFFAIQYLLGLLTCRDARIFILDLTHTADLISFVFWIAYHTFLQPGLLDPMGFVVFRIFRAAKILNVFRLEAVEENLAIYTDTMQLAYTAYGAVLRFLSMLILFFSILFYAFERGIFSEEEGIWIRDYDEGESPFANLFNCVYFTIVTFTTLGYGDFSPRSYVGRGVAIMAVLAGLGNLTFLINIIGDCFEEVFRVYVKTRSTKMEEAREAYIEEQINRANDHVNERLRRKHSRLRGETELMLDRNA